jgi:hypothetical protein
MSFEFDFCHSQSYFFLFVEIADVSANFKINNNEENNQNICEIKDFY